MKKRWLHLAIVIGITFSCTNHHKPAVDFDFSALEPFWEISELLKKDSTPSDALWDNLFETPGFKTLTTIEFPRDWIKSYLNNGLKPSERPLYEEWVAKGFQDTLLCVHMCEAASRRAEIQDFIGVLQSGSFMNQALREVKAFWPTGDTMQALPPISFIFFTRDARGYDPVLIDLLFANDLYKQDELDEMIAHEAHHYFRRRLLSFEYPPDTDSDFLIIHTLDQVHCEGIADQIDKSGMFANPMNATRSERYQNLLVKTPVDIAKLDSLLILYRSCPDSLKSKIAGQIQRSTPNSGHPMGYFLSSTILKNLGKDSLLQDIGNPFAFFWRYNRAAQLSKSKLPVFSDAALATLSEMEAKHRKKL